MALLPLSLFHLCFASQLVELLSYFLRHDGFNAVSDSSLGGERGPSLCHLEEFRICCCQILCSSVTHRSTKGILNDHFSYIQTQKTIEKPDHVVQLINMYCVDIDTILLELAGYVDLPDGDITRLTALARQIEERSSHIGVENMRLACARLVENFHEMNRTNCLRGLSWLKTEFSRARNKLQVIVQIFLLASLGDYTFITWKFYCYTSYGWSGKL